MSAMTLWRLWGRDADYVLSETAERPVGAMPLAEMPRIDGLMDLLRELVEAYPGNLDLLSEAVQRTATAVDSSPVETIASRIAAGITHLWRFPPAVLDVPPRTDRIPLLSELLPQRQGTVDLVTWIGVRAVDQYGRPLPWMRARIGVPDGRTLERLLDSDAHTSVERLPRPGVCWAEFRAERPQGATGSFVDATEPPRPAAVEPASWIGIRVVDQYGNDLPFMRARVTLPDGSEREPNLNSGARAKLDVPAMGACSLALQAGRAQGAA